MAHIEAGTLDAHSIGGRIDIDLGAAGKIFGTISGIRRSRDIAFIYLADNEEPVGLPVGTMIGFWRRDTAAVTDEMACIRRELRTLKRAVNDVAAILSPDQEIKPPVLKAVI